MINPTEKQLKSFNDEVKAFFVEIEEQKKRIQKDLQVVELPLLNRRICDFGCGLGYTTYCLASMLNATESIGVDTDPAIIHKASLWFKAVKLHKQLSAKEEATDEILTQEANQMLRIVQSPEFLVRDVVSGEDLPSNINLAYCRKLLVNILAGNYENNISGIDGCKLAIKNMAKTITPGGWLVAIEEKQGGDFSQLFEMGGLYCVDKTYLQLGSAIPCYRYVYRKPE